MKLANETLSSLQERITGCTACPRLVRHCTDIATLKRRAYRDWTYWGRPIPSFGDPAARLLIIGLAPGAHGANRTGRVFTGDSSGDLLYRVLHKAGFASQPESRSLNDGLQLRDAYIAISVRCAPPDNKPARDEFVRCRPYLEREMELLLNVKVVVALGKAAFDTYLSILRDRGHIKSRSPFTFGHNRQHRPAPGLPLLISSFHPSQQNTSTGRLTEDMFLNVFTDARAALEQHPSSILPATPVRPESSGRVTGKSSAPAR
ncbi:MAG TPA: uracil-DNA glycosylase [Bryobacteraceae bacterium]|nr:uracil-DNA glycosylase [Bryobacteraceae bacterium]